jgi:hypothetical protein
MSAEAATLAPPRAAAHAPALPVPFYADYPLDRAGALRDNERKLKRILDSGSGRFLLLSGGRALVVPAGEGSARAAAAARSWAPMPSAEMGGEAHEFPTATKARAAPAWLPLVLLHSEVLGGVFLDFDVPSIFLGLDAAGKPYFAAEVRSS